MEKFEKLTAIAAPMPLINIDTDMIIPKQFLKTIKRSGLGVSAFHEMRYHLDGSDNPDFILNKEAYQGVNILVAGDNFGCGSSREHAPWALLDFGIRCVISTSFADIFYNNCFKNGILPVIVTEDELLLLMKDAEKGSNARMVIDLEKQHIQTSDGEVINFDVDQHRKHCLINGLDDIGLTLEKVTSIDAFETQMAQSTPWV
ncbi:MAG: 3-isopropylmalate dehydratase small subunit [Planktomarina sp.]|jgi:3-isopropylmalate/(R)-2-methylmalate dehydratase small subunit|nr:3-isopropylmalate dehydratase small subunit [Planktomarina sp.]MDT2071827.1 3-isopropylmalate dehydratase small subunit [Planktomarina sp.]MDT2076683.1 3-isopropylmalate dehydratase small subunit [Planktomarina sp.]HAJ84510.1 3-isopropylmalate dehydratase small subunit [Paracoccaceae bacterium]|tara:strand:+ start:1727 stop:2332 length:606 start_codon:yes stop_codon:yes gene_type:complete